MTLPNHAPTDVAIESIQKAASGTIKRGSSDFPFTPLTAAMKVWGIAPTAQVRLTGATGETLVLQSGAPKMNHPEDFGFVFNMRGWPVLTPRLGTPAASAPVVNDRPQVRDVVRIEVIGK